MCFAMDNILGYYLMPHIPEIIDEIADSKMQRLKRTSEACEKIGKEISEIKPETIVILSSHGNLKENSLTINMGNYIYGNFNEFKNVDISFVAQLDTAFTDRLIEYLNKDSISHTIRDISCKDYKLDHGSTVPLYFIDKYYKDYKLVTISSSIENKDRLYEVGKGVRNICEMQGKKIVVIASCDVQSNKKLREMHENPYEKKVNRRVLESIDNLEVFKDYDTESLRFKEVQKYGINYIAFLLGALGGREINGILLSYERPFGTGYGVMKFKTT